MKVDTEKLRALLAALNDKNHPDAAEVDWHRVAVAAVNALPELLDALATAEAERLTLARAFDAAIRDLDCGDNSCRFKAHGKGGMRTNGGCRCLGVRDGGGMRGLEVSRAVEVARRIVAEADAAAAGKVQR